MTRVSLRQMILHILDDQENMATHARRQYWTDQIILLVRKDDATRLWKYFKDECGPITAKGMTAGPVCVDEIIALLEKP